MAPSASVYGDHEQSTAVNVIVAMAAAVEHQRHETAADHEGENDGEDHGYVAMDAHLHVNTVPGINSHQSVTPRMARRGRIRRTLFME